MSNSSNLPLATIPNATKISQHEAPTFCLTLLHIILFALPPLTTSLPQLSQTLNTPLVKFISISAAILMTLIFAQAFTKLARFRHPAGVLLQSINWHVINTYSFITWYTALPWQLGAASAITISCILYILVIVIADTIFWVVVAYGHSEEELGLYAQVQDGLGWVWARLSLLGLGLFAVIQELFTCQEPSTQTGTMTPPPLYDDTELLYRSSNIDKV